MRADFVLRESGAEEWWLPVVAGMGWFFATVALVLAGVTHSLLWLLVMVACDAVASWAVVWPRFDGGREVLTITEVAVQYTNGTHEISVPVGDVAAVDYLVGPERFRQPTAPLATSGQFCLSDQNGRQLLAVHVDVPVQLLLCMVRVLRQSAPHIAVGGGVLQLMAADLQHT